MEAPPLSTPPPTTPTEATPPVIYPYSVDSCYRSRKKESYYANPPPPAKLRIMCSYGGRIGPRPHDKTLCYVGGDTRIIVIERHTSLSDLHLRLSKNLFNNQPFSLKYQLPSEDLDSLITVTSDEDLENMVEEYERLNNSGGLKPGRLRLFLFPRSPASVDQLLVETASTEDWFFNALNGKTNVSADTGDHGCSESSSLNCLLGLDDEFLGKVEKDVEAQIEGFKSVANGNVGGNSATAHDVQSVTDSPMLETTSSFGSTSSSPSVANLPPIMVRIDENPKAGISGIEEQFQQMSVGFAGNFIPPPQKPEEVGVYMPAGVAPAMAASGLPVVVGGEYPNRVTSDDERSDHGGGLQAQQIQQVPLQPQQIPQFQQKQVNAFDLLGPESFSSDGSAANPLSMKRRQPTDQEPVVQINSGNKHKTGDQNNTKVQMQRQFLGSDYAFTSPYDKNQPQLHQPQQYVHPSNHYIPSPITSYYSVCPSQHQNHPHQSLLDQHYPVYYVHPTAPSHSQFVQVPSSQHQAQYGGFTPIHRPSSPPNSAYTYEFADPANAQVYYTPLPPQP